MKTPVPTETIFWESICMFLNRQSHLAELIFFGFCGTEEIARLITRYKAIFDLMPSDINICIVYCGWS